MKKFLCIVSFFFFSCGNEKIKRWEEPEPEPKKTLYDLNYLISACAKNYQDRDPIEMRSDAGTPGENEFPHCQLLKTRLYENNLNEKQVCFVLKSIRTSGSKEAKRDTQLAAHEAIRNLKALIKHLDKQK